MLSKKENYDSILIDEGQDLDQEWLKFVVKMLRNLEHSHFSYHQMVPKTYITEVLLV